MITKIRIEEDEAAQNGIIDVNSLSELEKYLLRKNKLIFVRGKRGTGVPVIINSFRYEEAY